MMFMSFRGLRMIAPHVADVFDGFRATIIAAKVQHLSLFVKSLLFCGAVELCY